MVVKSSKRIIVVRMLDWAILALVVLLFLIVLVGLTTNKPISFFGLQFNLKNNYVTTEGSNFIENASPIAPVNTSAAVPNKVIPSNQPAKNQSNASAVIKTQKKDLIINNPEVAAAQSERTVRKSKYAPSSPIKNDDDYSNQVTQESTTESNDDYSNNTNPYINNGGYRAQRESPRNNSTNGRGGRNFSQSEMNEFMRQFSNRKTDIHFVHFGYLDAEMESVRAQILAALNKNGYTNIDANWNRYTDYTTINEVHFGVNGYSGANFYIPKAKN